MTKKTKTEHPELIAAKKELHKLRELRTKGYCTPFGRIEELERFIATRGVSHGFLIR